MPRSGKFIFLVIISVFMLTACGQSLEKSANDAVNSAEEAFHANNKETNEKIGETKFYKPISFKVEDDSDAHNIVLNKANNPFILFINPNEQKDSRLFYDLLIADEKKNIVAEESFTEGDTIGFAAVVQNGNDDQVELIVSVGGIKMSTYVKESKITANLPKMMEIARSIKQK